MDIKEAKALAAKSECGNKLKDYYCNPATGTWWINLDIKKENCNPACVVWVETKKAEINWLCSGYLVPQGY